MRMPRMRGVPPEDRVGVLDWRCSRGLGVLMAAAPTLPSASVSSNSMWFSLHFRFFTYAVVAKEPPCLFAFIFQSITNSETRSSADSLNEDTQSQPVSFSVFMGMPRNTAFSPILVISKGFLGNLLLSLSCQPPLHLCENVSVGM